MFEIKAYLILFRNRFKIPWSEKHKTCLYCQQRILLIFFFILITLCCQTRSCNWIGYPVFCEVLRGLWRQNLAQVLNLVYNLNKEICFYLKYHFSCITFMRSFDGNYFVKLKNNCLAPFSHLSVKFIIDSIGYKRGIILVKLK